MNNNARIAYLIPAAFVVGILFGAGWSEYRHYQLNLEQNAYDANVNLINDLAVVKALESKNADLAMTIVLSSIKLVVDNPERYLTEIKNSETKSIMQNNIELGKQLLKTRR